MQPTKHLDRQHQRHIGHDEGWLSATKFDVDLKVLCYCLSTSIISSLFSDRKGKELQTLNTYNAP